ncbi:MAG: GxxExxY protein [Kiritimatiellia bacterium]|nr:GxxExxY protein [Kiritimatiellia bacterium]
MPDKDLTEGIIQAAIAVHRTLGPGFLESLYSGLLLNFAAMPLTVKRVGRERSLPLPDFLCGNGSATPPPDGCWPECINEYLHRSPKLRGFV